MKIEFASLEPGSEFTIDGAAMVISGVSHVVSRNSVVESLGIQYEKKAETDTTTPPVPTAEVVQTDIVRAADEPDSDNKVKGRRKLSDETITQG